MKKYFSVLCLLLALSSFLIAASPGYCYREKPEDLISDNSCTAGVKKILVTYDTKHGATSLISGKIFQTLCAEGFSVDLIFVENLDADTIGGYDGIVIGSPIYIAKWLPGIKNLLKKHHAEIAKVPSAFFITCTYLKDENDTPERRSGAYDIYIKKVLEDYPDIQPVSTGVLSGEFQYAELYPIEIFLMKLSKFEEGDFRNEEKIEAWAKEVAQQFK
jgi:menaquinone-dependent protoporphyrinogen oxidase